ncbi:MAG: carboxypeptidase-like regulatory domain-containing protein [Bacteroidota bacterium]
MRLALLALLLPLAASAQQTGKLAGRVVDDLGDPLPGANVILEDTQLGAAADADGNYFVIGVPVGTYDVTASFIGFRSHTVEDVQISSGYTTLQDFELGRGCRTDSSYQAEDLSRVNEDLVPKVNALAGVLGWEPLSDKREGSPEVRIWHFDSHSFDRFVRFEGGRSGKGMHCPVALTTMIPTRGGIGKKSTNVWGAT